MHVFDVIMRKLKAKNGDIQNVHVAADPEAVLTNKAKAGTLRRSLRNRREPRWLSDYMHKAPHGMGETSVMWVLIHSLWTLFLCSPLSFLLPFLNCAILSQVISVIQEAPQKALESEHILHTNHLLNSLLYIVNWYTTIGFYTYYYSYPLIILVHWFDFITNYTVIHCVYILVELNINSSWVTYHWCFHWLLHGWQYQIQRT